MNAPSLFSQSESAANGAPIGEPEREVPTGFARLKARFEDRTLTAKLRIVVFGVAIIPFFVAAVLLFQFAFYGQAGSDHAERVRAEVLVAEAALAIAQTAADLDTAEEQQSEELLRSAGVRAAMARDKLTQAITLGQDRFPEETIDQFRSARDEIAEKTVIVQGLSFEKSPQEITDLQPWASECADKLATIFNGARVHAIATMESILDGIMVGFALCVGLMLSAIAASFLGARTMIAHVVGQITDITDVMENLAEGDVDAAIPGGHRKDEIGAMARSLGVFRAKSLALRDLTSARARDAEKQLAQEQSLGQQMRELRRDKSQLLEGLADGFEVSVGELITAVSSASEQLKATSRQMGELAEGSKGQAESATEAMENATANVTAAAAATDQFALSINEISRQASASAELARGASELVTTANTKMTDLSHAALEIGEIAGLIQTIAQRTNLLALNASIEAARGGEAGRGFAVVASEVKELAMQTSNATRSVAEKITAMQDFTESSAGDLTSIVDRIGELEQASVMIATAVDEQSVSGEELARNIDTAAAGSAQVGTRLTTLREASQETGNAADDVVLSAQALGAHANDLRAKAGRFIADVRRSARDLESDESELETRAA